MSSITILHNPRCSKSRQTLALLEEQGISPTVVEYLKTPLNRDDITSLFQKLGIESAHHMIRPKEAEFKEAGLSKASSNEEVFDALVSYPKLLERPVVINGNKAKIGRPPESVLDIL